MHILYKTLLILFIIRVFATYTINNYFYEDDKIYNEYLAQYEETSCVILKTELKVVDEQIYYVNDYQVLKGKMKGHILHKETPFYDRRWVNVITCWTNEKNNTIQIVHPHTTFIWSKNETIDFHEIFTGMKILCDISFMIISGIVILALGSMLNWDCTFDL